MSYLSRIGHFAAISALKLLLCCCSLQYNSLTAATPAVTLQLPAAAVAGLTASCRVELTAGRQQPRPASVCAEAAGWGEVITSEDTTLDSSAAARCCPDHVDVNSQSIYFLISFSFNGSRYLQYLRFALLLVMFLRTKIQIATAGKAWCWSLMTPAWHMRCHSVSLVTKLIIYRVTVTAPGW